MDWVDGEPGTRRVLSAIEESLGACKKDGDTVTTPEWEKIFSIVREMKEPHGYVTAMAAWTQVSFKVVKKRYRTGDASIHYLGRHTAIPRIVEDDLARRLNDQAFTRSASVPSMLPVALQEAALLSHATVTGGSRGHRRRFLRRHGEVRLRMANFTEQARILGMTRMGYNRFVANLKEAHIEDVPDRKRVNVDEASVINAKLKGKAYGPAWKVLKRLSRRTVGTTKHMSIVVAVRANGLPYGTPIFIVKGKRVDAEWVEDTDEYRVIETESGGMEQHAWEKCCRYWASIAEGVKSSSLMATRRTRTFWGSMK